MEFIARFIITVSGNLAAILLTAYFENDFIVATNTEGLVRLVLILTAVNLTLRPLLNIIFNPLINITFGFFNVVLSAAILYGIDIYSDSLTINGLWPLIIGAHAMGFIIMLIDYSGAIIYGGGQVQ